MYNYILPFYKSSTPTLSGSRGTRRPLPQICQINPRGAAEVKFQEPAAGKETVHIGRHVGEEGSPTQ